MNKQLKLKVQRKKLSGKVVSNKMDKTVIIEIAKTRIHPLYKKRYRVDKRIMAHDPKNQYKVDDLVEIKEDRHRSKNKSYIVVKKVAK